MNTRLCPHRSPALPNAGPTTAKANIGPVMAQVSNVFDECRSVAICFNDTTNKVIVKLTVNRPPSTIHNTAHGWVTAPESLESPC